MISIAGLIVNFISSIVILIPRPVQMAIGRFLGRIWFYVVRIRRDVAFENLKKAFPEKNEKEIYRIALENYKNYGCGFIEFLILPHFNKAQFDKLVSVEGRENYLKAYEQGKGVFLLTLHLGCWELMSGTCAFLDIPLHIITKKFKAKSLNQIWVDIRVKQGIKLISEEKSTFQILRALKDKGAVGFILDQFLGPPVGVKTKFFGIETGTPAALALFAERTGAPVVPVYNVRQPDGKIKIYFEPAISFVEQGSVTQNISFMTQVYTDKIEEIVRKYPEQWLWIHRRWKPFGGA